MRVFNLTGSALDFHGKTLPARGGSVDIPELDSFLPDRDKRLEKEGVISLGYLPEWWKEKMSQEAVRQAEALLQAAAQESPKPAMSFPPKKKFR